MRPLLLCLLVGCVASEPAPTETTSALMGDCWDLNCPGNSNVLGGLGPYELSLSGTPSSRGFWFDHTSITRQQGAGPIHHIQNFQVLGGTVHANDLDDGNKPITRDEIDGLRIPVYFNGTSRHPAQRYVLRIIRRENVEYYDGSTAPVDGYYIAYKKVDGDGNDPVDPANGMPTETWKDMCPYVEYDAGPGVSGSTWAVFWKGDRYDPATGKILESDVPNGDWFNLGCAGDASVKMVRAKASAVTAAGIAPSVKQATLNMFTAKYCPNDPTRFTHVGVRISWDDKTVPSSLAIGYQTEAVWNADGAVCLSTQRSTKDGIADCLDECTPDQKKNWSQYGDLRSGVGFVLSGSK